MAINKVRRASKFAIDCLRGDDQAINRIRSFAYPVVYKAMFSRARKDGGGVRRLFVDAGANVGQGFGFFKTVFKPSDYTYHFFEPNPNCVAVLEGNIANEKFPNGYRVHQKAVWIKNETLKFYGISESGSSVTQGGSVLADHNSLYYESDPGCALEVEAISFADYLVEVQQEFDEIVLKIDIEGAELDVLEDLQARMNLFRKPTIMFVEFHAIYAGSDKKQSALERERVILRNVPENVKMFRWY